MSTASPTARTLALLRSEGFEAAVVERRLPHCFTTVDLFGAFDLVAIRVNVPGVLGVQTTSASNHRARVKKLQGNPVLGVWLAVGCRAEVWNWGKRKGRWVCRREAVAAAPGLPVDVAVVSREADGCLDAGELL